MTEARNKMIKFLRSILLLPLLPFAQLERNVGLRPMTFLIVIFMVLFVLFAATVPLSPTLDSLSAAEPITDPSIVVILIAVILSGGAAATAFVTVISLPMGRAPRIASPRLALLLVHNYLRRMREGREASIDELSLELGMSVDQTATFLEQYLESPTTHEDQPQVSMF